MRVDPRNARSFGNPVSPERQVLLQTPAQDEWHSNLIRCQTCILYLFAGMVVGRKDASFHVAPRV